MPFDPTAISNSLRKGLSHLQNFDLSAAGGDMLVAQLTRYLQELEKWNQAYNLTAVRDPADMVPRHLLDALAVNPYLRGKRVLDVGTGAGLPGIPLALVNPDKQFMLLDANGKKIRFVQHVVGVLGLSNVEPVQARIESWDFAQPFDVIVSRAFSTLADFINGSGRMLGPGGCLLAMKGKLPGAELAELPSGWWAAGVHAIHVPELDAERHAVVLQPSAN
jgi:16S rRNA (guanine527-N7)-methyltransferase